MPNLEKLFTQQIQLLNQLQMQLETELHLISGRDPEKLTSLVNEKSATIDQIAETDAAIEQAYEQVSESDKQAVAELADKARECLVQCQYRTDINAKAVEQGQLRLEHLRNLLLESRAKETMTYDKSGKTQASTSQHSTSA